MEFHVLGPAGVSLLDVAAAEGTTGAESGETDARGGRVTGSELVSWLVHVV